MLRSLIVLAVLSSQGAAFLPARQVTRAAHRGPPRMAAEETGAEQPEGSRDFSRMDGELRMPVGLGDWREMRARLSAGSEDAWRAQLKRNKNPIVEGENTWAHELATAEEGMVLLAGRDEFLGSQTYFHQTAIFIISHNEDEGSYGVIINRPTSQVLGAVSADIEAFEDAPVYFGGDVGSFVTSLHPYGQLPGAKKVIDGVYWGGDFEVAGDMVRAGAAHADDFRFFLRGCGWAPGQLQSEIDRGVWYAAATSANLINKHCINLSRPLWAEILDTLGGGYAEIAEEEYGPAGASFL